MKTLPLPLRLAAGLVATAVEQARELPRQIVEFPVTAVSQALQASMRVQQRVTELAIKGDRALGTLRPVEEKPSWATFDEDLPRNGASTVTELRPRPETPADVAARTTARAAAAPPVLAPPEPARESPEADGTAPVTAKAAVETATTATAAGTAARATARAARPTPPPVVETPADDPGPNALPGYAQLTIPQLRGRLRFLSLDDLRALVVYETTHGDRAPYVTMLTNRITSVTEG